MVDGTKTLIISKETKPVQRSIVLEVIRDKGADFYYSENGGVLRCKIKLILV